LTGSITLANANLFHNHPLLRSTRVLCSPARSRVGRFAIITSAADTNRHKIIIMPVRNHTLDAPPRCHPSSPQTVLQCQRRPAQPLQNQERHPSLSCCTIICSRTLTRHTTTSPSQTSCQHAASPL